MSQPASGWTASASHVLAELSRVSTAIIATDVKIDRLNIKFDALLANLNEDRVKRAEELAVVVKQLATMDKLLAITKTRLSIQSRIWGVIAGVVASVVTVLIIQFLGR